MRATSVTYGRLKSGPGYSNERAEITLELCDGEKAVDAMKMAKRFVDHQLGYFQETLRLAEEEIPF